MKKNESFAALFHYNLTVITLDATKSVNPSIAIDQPTNHSISQSINQSINGSIHPSIHPSISQSINQSINQSNFIYRELTLNSYTTNKSVSRLIMVIEQSRVQFYIEKQLGIICTREQIGPFCNFHEWLPQP